MMRLRRMKPCPDGPSCDLDENIICQLTTPLDFFSASTVQQVTHDITVVCRNLENTPDPVGVTCGIVVSSSAPRVVPEVVRVMIVPGRDFKVPEADRIKVQPDGVLYRN